MEGVSATQLNLSLATPQKFSFDPLEWLAWKQRFLKYICLSGINTRPNDKN